MFGVVVKDISELLNIELNLTAANGSEMLYIYMMGGAKFQTTVLQKMI